MVSKQPRDCTNRVCSIYKNRLTGHWMVDQTGTKDHPGSPAFKQGFTTFVEACEGAAELVDFQVRHHSRKRAS